MAQVQFPSSPSDGDQYTVNNVTYTWNNTAGLWEANNATALADTFVEVAGDTMTGALNVPAGATTTQVPQVQEVVLKAGDTMTGDLTVPNLTVPGVITNQQVASAYGRSSTTGLSRSYNVASATYATGLVTVVFAVPMADDQYTVVANFDTSRNSSGDKAHWLSPRNQTATGLGGTGGTRN